MYKVTWTSSKAFYAVWGAIFSFTQNIHSAMIGLLICMVIDTITGFIAAPYRGQLRDSARLSRVVKKIITYFTAAITLHIAEMMILPTYIAGTLELARMAFSVFSILEIYSICENLYDWTGLPIFRTITQMSLKKIGNSIGLDLDKKELSKNKKRN
jgi:phage-related holin